MRRWGKRRDGSILLGPVARVVQQCRELHCAQRMTPLAIIIVARWSIGFPVRPVKLVYGLLCVGVAIEPANTG